MKELIKLNNPANLISIIIDEKTRDNIYMRVTCVT